MKRNKIFCILASLTMLVAAGASASYNNSYVNQNPVVAEAAEVVGNYSSVSTTEDGKERFWNFAEGTNESDKIDVAGKTDNYLTFVAGSKSGAVRHYAGNNMSFRNKAGIFIPVPNNSTGTLSIIDSNWENNYADRIMSLITGGTTYDKGSESSTKYVTASLLDSEGVEVGQNTFNFDSSDIITLDDGTTCLYVRSTTSNENKWKTLKITLETGSYNDKIQPNGINLSRDSYEGYIGGSFKLDVSITPSGADGEIVWESSNNNIATVDDSGNVSLLSLGTAVITATIKDTTFSESCTVVVMDPDALSYSVNFSEMEKTTISDSTNLNNSIFKALVSSDKPFVIDNSKKTVEDIQYTQRLKFGGASTFDENSKLRVIEFTTDSPGILTYIVASGNESNERDVNVYKNGSDSTPITKNVTTPVKISIKLDSAATYYITSTSKGVNFYYLEFVPSLDEEINETTAVLNYQYDNDATPTAIRFIGTITNLADYKTIESITLSFKLGTNEADVNITKLYTSVANTFEAVDNTYYVCYAITEITAAIGQSFEATLTVTFNNDNEALTQTRSFTLGE